MTNTQQHIPVMLAEVMAALELHDNGVYIDGTFGRGGYSRAMLAKPGVTVYGIDRDPEAIVAGQAMVKEFAPRFKLLQGAFGDMLHLLANEHASLVDGIALDIGVSSPQINQAERGFSFQADGPLDMRMSLSGPTAADIVNTRTERELADLIYLFGEEHYSRRIAKRIVAERASTPLTRTQQLADLVRKVVPRSADGLDPATRTFQALRIVVNDELGELERGMKAAEKLLKPQGRLVVVAFHSLEDRCVKEFLRVRSGKNTGVSRYAPANDTGLAPTFRLLTRKPLVPSSADIAHNPRARSAKLRVAERTEAPPPMENAV